MNFNVYIRILSSLMMSLVIGTSLTALVYTSHLKTADKKQVLLLGDLHNLTDEELLILFKQRMSCMSQARLTRPIPFVVELDEKYKRSAEGIDSKNLLFLLGLDNGQQRSARKPFAFDFYEPRTLLSDYLTGFMTQMARIILDELPVSHVYFHYKVNKTLDATISLESYTKKWFRSLQEQIHEEKRLKGSPTIGALKKNLETNRVAMGALLDTYKDQDMLAEQIEESIRRYEEAHEACLEALHEFKDDQLFRVAFCMLLQKCRSAEETMTLFDHLYAIFQMETDFIYADLCFFDKIVKKLATDPCVCVFVGYAHAKAATRYLRAFGCEVITEKNCMGPVTPLLQLMLPNAHEMNLLEQGTIDRFLEPLKDQKDLTVCTHCHQTKEKMMKCSRCKQGVYCNAECQKADWPNHKKICAASK